MSLDRYRGSILGLAVGDALGAPLELDPEAGGMCLSTQGEQLAHQHHQPAGTVSINSTLTPPNNNLGYSGYVIEPFID